MREERSTGSLTDMTNDVFAESLKSLECIEILFNYLKNLKKQKKKKRYLHINTLKKRPSN